MELELKVELVIGGFYGSALHSCAWKGKEEAARILLEHGVDPNIQGKPPLLMCKLGLI